MRKLEKYPVPVLVIGIIGTSLSAIFVKYSNAPSLVTATFRLLWTVALMTPVVLCKKKFRNELHNTNIKTLFLCALSGIFLAIHFVLWFESLNYTSVASSTAIVCTEVIWVAIGFNFFPGGHTSAKAWLSISITVLGSFIITIADFMQTSGGLYGDILALVAAVAAAAYTLIGKFARTNMTTTIYTYVVYLFCGASLCITCIINQINCIEYGISSIIVGLLLCIFSTLLGHTIFSWSLRYLSPSFVSASKLCQAPVAAIFAFLLFSELPSLYMIIGGLITIGGVVLYSKAEHN